jgi:hypothetical protein
VLHSPYPSTSLLLTPPPLICPLQVGEELKSYFRPEFLNRLDEIIVFRQLTKKEVKQIADIFLKDVFKRADEKGIKIEVVSRQDQTAVAGTREEGLMWGEGVECCATCVAAGLTPHWLPLAPLPSCRLRSSRTGW